MANLLSTSIAGTATTSGSVVIGGTFANNAYNSVSSTRLLFGGGNEPNNYFIGTNLENYGGNYTKLDLRWHTGIRMGARPEYGGIRFFNNETLGSRIMSIGESDANVRIDNNLWIGGAGGWITDLFNAKQNASTAITTSNIGSQSVSYATTAGSANSVTWSNVSGKPSLDYQQEYVFTAPASTDGSGYSWVRISMGGFNSGGDFVRFSIGRAIGWNDNNPYGGPSMDVVAYSREWHGGQDAAVITYAEHGSVPGSGFVTNAGPRDLAGGGYWFYMRIWGGVDYVMRVYRGSGPIGTSWEGTSDPGSVFKVKLGVNNIGPQHTGFSTNGQMRSDIYYDYNDEGYYGDFNSRSVLNSLQLGTASSDTTNLKLDVQGNMAIRGTNGLYFGVSTNNYNSWSTKIYASGSTQYFNAQQFIFDNQGYGGQTFVTINSAGVYTNGWFRNYGAQGIYNESYGTHFYSYGSQSWGITGSGSNIYLAFRSNHESTIRGYVYADTSNQIGFLNNGGSWAFRTTSNNSALVHGTDLTINADGAGSSNIIMNDGDEGSRVIHCNSNRIGFLTQGGSWGSYCNDDGSWATGVAMYSPIYYDSNDTGYYVDPNDISHLHISRTALRAHRSMSGYGVGNWVSDFSQTPISSMTFGQDKYDGGPSGTWWFQVNMRHNNGSNLWGTQLAYGWEDNANEIWQRNVTGGNWSGWVRYLNSNNYGAYAVPITGTVLTEGNYFYFRSNRGSYLGGLDSATLQVYATGGNSAFMSFHRSASYAVNFGLDADNVMRIGGWSAAADRWVLDMSGNNTVAGSFRAPIFYDSNDTTYYLDPNSSGTSLKINGGIVSTAGNGAVLLKHENSEANAWIFRENSNNWGLFWFNAGGQSGQTIGSYTTVGAELFGMNNAVTGFNPNSAWSGTDASTRAAWMLSNYSGYLWTQGTQYSETDMRAPIFYDSANTNRYLDLNSTAADAMVISGGIHISRDNVTGNGIILADDGDIVDLNDGYCAMRFSYGIRVHSGNRTGSAVHTLHSDGNAYFNTSAQTPIFLVNSHSDNTKGYRIYNTSNSSVSAMFVNSSNQLVIAAGAVDQINLNKKVYVNGVALGVNVAPSATAGRIDASNDIVAYSSSDERLKENITPIENALDKVKSLTGVEFDWKPEYKHAHGYEGHDTGIIAQQVEAVMPSAVRTNDTGFLAVRYEKLIGLLIEGMKEQQAQIDELKAKLDGLTK